MFSKQNSKHSKQPVHQTYWSDARWRQRKQVGHVAATTTTTRQPPNTDFKRQPTDTRPAQVMKTSTGLTSTITRKHWNCGFVFRQLPGLIALQKLHMRNTQRTISNFPTGLDALTQLQGICKNLASHLWSHHALHVQAGGVYKRVYWNVTFLS